MQQLRGCPLEADDSFHVGSVLRMVKLLLLLVVLAAGGAAATAAEASHPAARVRCRDGTTSVAKHHARACSHHGGVARVHGSGAAKMKRIRLGRTVLLERRTRESRCKLGAMPDRRCSPGAYSSRLTKPVICSSRFHTSMIRRAPLSEKHAVEREYGLPAGHYGHALEIDHIVPLRLGGSNSIANLYPEEYAFADGSPGFRVKDKMENRLRAMVCAGQISLRFVQRQVAANWQKLYQGVFGVPASPRMTSAHRHANAKISR